jgi:hypothetical protein
VVSKQVQINITGAGYAPYAGTANAIVDDDALSGSYGGTGTLTGGTTATGTLLVNCGADGQGPISFAPNGVSTFSQAGLTMTWNAADSKLTATKDFGSKTETIFEVSLNGTAYTVKLLNAYPGGESVLPLNYYVQDGNGSVTTGTLNINFGDDAAGPFTAEAAVLHAQPGSSDTATLNAFTNLGADEFGNVSFTTVIRP